MANLLVQDYLKKHGVLSASTLKKILVEEHHFTPGNASQIISRALKAPKEKGGIDVVRNILPKRTGLLFLLKERNTEKFWKGVLSEMQKSKGAYSHALNSVIARTGVVPISHFHISCGSPSGKLKKHPSSTTILKRLIDVNFLQIQNILGLGECVILNRSMALSIGIKTDTTSLWLRLKLEEIVLECVSLWIKNLNLSGYNQLRSRHEPDYTPVGAFGWDLSGASYLNAMRINISGASPKPGFVVADLLLSKRYLSLNDVEPFIAKCSSLRAQMNKSSIGILEIFVAFNYNKEAFNKLKGIGVIPATITNIFGQQLATSLFGALDMLSAIGDLDLNKLDTFLLELSRIEGPALNIRGTLFTLIVCDILRKEGWTILSYDKNIKHEGKTREIDIIAERGEEMLCVECKGKQIQNLADAEEVTKWLEKTIPHFIKHNQTTNLVPKKLLFQFWSASGFTEEALVMFDSKMVSIDEVTYPSTSCGPDEIRRRVLSLKDGPIMKILKEHYINHPLKNKAVN